MTIEWTADLATGIADIDEQHRELYSTIGALHEAMKANRLEHVQSVLEFLERYARDHFASEERVMLRAGYPKLADHREAHQAFVTDFLDHRARLAGGVTASGVIALSGWLGQWLRDHVRRIDGEMARFVRERAR